MNCSKFKAVKLEDIVNILKEYADFYGLEKKDHKKPGHGSCCTCQNCGYCYDECVCLHNEILEELKKVIVEVKNVNKIRTSNRGCIRYSQGS